MIIVHQPGSNRIVQQVVQHAAVTLFGSKGMIMESTTPDRAGDAWQFRNPIAGVAFQCVHEGRQSAVIELACQMNVIGHYHHRIKPELASVVQKLNAVQDDAGCVIVIRKDRSAPVCGGSEEVTATLNARATTPECLVPWLY